MYLSDSFLNKKGYNIIVLSFVIFIVSIVVSMTMNQKNIDAVHDKMLTTNEIFKELDIAMLSYLAENKRLPCPAPLNCNEDNCDFALDKLGVEKKSSSTGLKCIVDNAGIFEGKNKNSETILYGNVPATTLGLSNNFLIDAWGNKIIYMVPQILTEENSLKNEITPHKQLLSKNGLNSLNEGKFIENGEIFMFMSFNSKNNGSFSYNNKKSNYFEGDENLPVQNFILNTDNKDFLYYLKKTETIPSIFGSDTSVEGQADIAEPNCERVEYTYVFNVKSNARKITDVDEYIKEPNLDIIGKSFTFDYTGSPQTITIPNDIGEIFIETWGARGGHAGSSDKGGEAGYSYGYFDVNNLEGENRKLYIYVGGKGVSDASNGVSGGYNGGGTSIGDASGGGASDVRLIGGDWDNLTSLNSRIIVAGGGGGATNRSGSTSRYSTLLPEHGGYGGGGNNDGGLGMNSYANWASYNKYYYLFGFGAGGNLCKIPYLYGKSPWQGGGGYYGGLGGWITHSYPPGTYSSRTCYDGYKNSKSIGGGGGGSGYINGVSDSTNGLSVKVGTGLKGGLNGRSCTYTIRYKDNYNASTVSGLTCNNQIYNRDFSTKGLSDINIKDGEGKVRISYSGLRKYFVEEDLSQTYTYTIVFPEAKYGEEIISEDSCPSLVGSKNAEPLDYYLLSTNRDVNTNLINNNAVNKCGRGGVWEFSSEDYDPENPETKTKKCIILPRCEKGFDIEQESGTEVKWFITDDEYDSGSYKVVNSGTIKGIKRNSEKVEEEITLQCITTLKKDLSCTDTPLSCYNDLNNYESKYYKK